MPTLSDEELLNSDPPSIEEEEEPTQTQETESQTEPETEPAEEPKEEESTEPAEEEEEAPVKEEIASDENVSLPEAKQVKQPVVKETAAADGKPVEKKAEVAAPNYEESYKKIMAPFKANGRTVELKSPEEAIQLMQMGANFTRKMQALAPHRKILTMLENNNLLDESRISYLIDLDKKDPNAIQKLIKDSGVDPLSIDTDKEVSYQGGNHKVSDTEVTFKAHLEDLQSTPEGLQTLQVINGSWDQPSKEILWDNPEIMNAINIQRENGVYDRIVTEIERQKLLGSIPANTPFLHAYKQVGDVMFATPAPVSKPVATRVVTPKPVVTNSEKANAASGTRATKSSGSPLSLSNLSDDDFLKSMSNRV